MPTPIPTIPQNITVHLGLPNSDAENVTMPFPVYIKNVASTEIYPTWPESALRANIYAMISFTLNRIYNEHYRSRGYNFDITNSPEYDQAFEYGRDYYNNISTIVDDIFNDYVVKGVQVQPYFTQYCKGNDKPCEGLSQWGTVSLAGAKYTPLQILQYYYGNDVGIVENAPVEANVESYLGVPLRLGSGGEEMRTLQRQLDTISEVYPAIPRVPVNIGIFDEATRMAVMKFQEIFDLPVDGIVGKATWYKIKFIYNGIKMVEKLSSKGLTPADIEELYQRSYKLGDKGDPVTMFQFYLNFLSLFDHKIPPVEVNGVFGAALRDAAIAFQKEYGFKPTGIVDRETWNKIQQVYKSIYEALPRPLNPAQSQYYPGYFVTTGSDPKIVTQLQTYLNVIAQNDKSIPPVGVNGVYGPEMQAAVTALQKQEGISVSGYVGPSTWTAIVKRYNALQNKIK